MPTKRFPGSNLHLPGRKPGTMDGYKDLKTVTVHTEGVYRPRQDAYAVARYVHSRDIGYHYVISDQQDTVISLYDYDVASRALGNDWRHPWKGVNRRGATRLQICWAGYTLKVPDTKRGTRYHDFAQWIAETVGVPSTTPQNWGHPTRKWANWERPGWSGHCHAPGNNHTDGTRTNPNNLWLPDDKDGCDMSLEYGALAGPKELIIPPDTARWVKWGGPKKSWHPAGSPSLTMSGPTTATVQLRATGALTVVYQLLRSGTNKQVGGGHRDDIQAGRSLTTTQVNIRPKTKLRIKLVNRGRVPVTVDYSQVRVTWCE